jgi:hypothetical protein
LTKPESKSSPQPAESATPSGGDETLELLQEYKIPVTRENYLHLAYFGKPPPWTAELEAELPEQLQDWKQFSGGRKSQTQQPSDSAEEAMWARMAKEHGWSPELAQRIRQESGW